MARIYIFKRFERFWHWTQAALIIFMLATGFEIHGSYTLFGWQKAADWHTTAAWTLIGLWLFAIFWHFTTGEWRQYLPTRQMLKAEAEYYLIGIFRDAPHPTRKTAVAKLNPLQKLVYFALKMLVIPVMVVSGLVYMFFRYPQSNGIGASPFARLEAIALIHTAGAFLLMAFVIGHAYLITTGSTAVSNLKAMITGHEDLQAEGPECTTPSETLEPEEEAA